MRSLSNFSPYFVIYMIRNIAPKTVILPHVPTAAFSNLKNFLQDAALNII